ncbi:MAG: type II toxin-antitoxin system RelE/ParE family toxin [Patescibacteria group bacterium]|nr:type II toxin-antitoxin system RelE/ParE family toxin [Patescibacteria group bacterium]MCL5431941.1 type II toxin-antitoxin system RelE/ParE family toxin [Patescibacteria group bacterium]
MSWTVNLYPKESEKFLDKLDKLTKGKVIRELQELQLTGFSEHNDSLKKMVGLPNIWELKTGQCRIFLVATGGETIQILHMTIKKSNKTPLEVIELIKNRAKYFGGAK